MKQNKKQVDKFKKTAREHGCDESEEAFNDKLKKLAESGKKESKE